MARLRTAAALLVSALAAAPVSHAQPAPGAAPPEGSEGQAPPEGSETQAPPEPAAPAPNPSPGDGSGDAAAAGGDSAPAPAPGPVTLADAKANIGTIIQSFFAQRAVDGAVPLRDKSTKRLRRLQLLKVDEKRVAETGPSRYSAPASLKDLESGQTLQASFTVDFGGADWKVVGMRLKTPAAKGKP